MSTPNMQRLEQEKGVEGGGEENQFHDQQQQQIHQQISGVTEPHSPKSRISMSPTPSSWSTSTSGDEEPPEQSYPTKVDDGGMKKKEEIFKFK